MVENVRDTIVACARSWIGTPYKHQASLKGAGTDCLGLVLGVYAEVVGKPTQTPPPYTATWAEDLNSEILADGLRGLLTEIDLNKAQKGDIVLFRWREGLPAKHCAILTAFDHMIHCYSGHAVLETAIPRQWRQQMAYAFQMEA